MINIMVKHNDLEKICSSNFDIHKKTFDSSAAALD
jgi:hypothetical protein